MIIRINDNPEPIDPKNCWHRNSEYQKPKRFGLLGNGSIALMSEQAKDYHSCRRSHVYLAVGHDRRDELIVGEAVSSIRSLIAAVKLVTQVGRVIGVQYAVSGVLDSPDDTILRAIGTYAGRCSRIGKYR